MNGCGSTLKSWGYAGVGLRFHLPRCYYQPNVHLQSQSKKMQGSVEIGIAERVTFTTHGGGQGPLLAGALVRHAPPQIRAARPRRDEDCLSLGCDGTLPADFGKSFAQFSHGPFMSLPFLVILHAHPLLGQFKVSFLRLGSCFKEKQGGLFVGILSPGSAQNPFPKQTSSNVLQRSVNFHVERVGFFSCNCDGKHTWFLTHKFRGAFGAGKHRMCKNPPRRKFR